MHRSGIGKAGMLELEMEANAQELEVHPAAARREAASAAA